MSQTNFHSSFHHLCMSQINFHSSFRHWCMSQTMSDLQISYLISSFALAFDRDLFKGFSLLLSHFSLFSFSLIVGANLYPTHPPNRFCSLVLSHCWSWFYCHCDHNCHCPSLEYSTPSHPISRWIDASFWFMPRTALQRHFGVVVPFSICGPARLPIDLRPGKSCLRCLGLEMSKQRNSLQLEDGDLRTSGRLTRKSERL